MRRHPKNEKLFFNNAMRNREYYSPTASQATLKINKSPYGARPGVLKQTKKIGRKRPSSSKKYRVMEHKMKTHNDSPFYGMTTPELLQANKSFSSTSNSNITSSVSSSSNTSSKSSNSSITKIDKLLATDKMLDYVDSLGPTSNKGFKIKKLKSGHKSEFKRPKSRKKSKTRKKLKKLENRRKEMLDYPGSSYSSNPRFKIYDGNNIGSNSKLQDEYILNMKKSKRKRTKWNNFLKTQQPNAEDIRDLEALKIIQWDEEDEESNVKEKVHEDLEKIAKNELKKMHSSRGNFELKSVSNSNSSSSVKTGDSATERK